MKSASRIGIIAVLIIAFVMAGMTRDWARLMRGGRDAASESQGATSLANMNSFALALLLGGLRGPLVMFLWVNSENLKNEKNLEDFDTYVEWIRLLQPEFDTVHIFQVWNKAYNISVQMASLANKYTTILDAVDYAQRVEAQRPNNISMIYQIGSIFSDKLGGASEKNYYKKRVRSETLPHASKQKLARTDPGWRRLELDPMLDKDGNILPELLKPRYERPVNLANDAPWADGSELQYLAKFQPFPYGISALGLGYNYQKKAQVLQDISKRSHANLSPMVLDSRPALSLKTWSDDEWEHGRRVEMKALNIAVPTERREMELGTASIAVDAPFTVAGAVPEAILAYDLGARLVDDAMVEYKRHLQTYPFNLSNYRSHMDSLLGQQALMRGDRDYLKAMLAKGDERKSLLASAAEHYRESIRLNAAIVFRYYIPQELFDQIAPKGTKRDEMAQLPYDQVVPLYTKAIATLKALQFDPDNEDRSDYQRYIERAQLRLKQIGG